MRALALPRMWRWALLLPFALGGCWTGVDACEGPPNQIADGTYTSDRCAPFSEDRLVGEVIFRMDADGGYAYVEYEIQEGGEVRKVEERWRIHRRDGELQPPPSGVADP